MLCYINLFLLNNFNLKNDIFRKYFERLCLILKLSNFSKKYLKKQLKKYIIKVI